MPLLKKYKLVLIAIILFFLILPLFPVRADIAPLIPNRNCIKDGNCSLCDLVGTFVNIGVAILGFIGALTLLAFIYGGLRMLTSGGDTGKAKKGQSVLVNSVIGLFIVLFAYAFVVIIISTFTEPGKFKWSTSLTCTSAPPQPEPPPPPPTPTENCNPTYLMQKYPAIYQNVTTATCKANIAACQSAGGAYVEKPDEWCTAGGGCCFNRS